MRPWASLESEEQINLQVAFGHYLDTLPRTCSLEVKVERFRSWLQSQGIDYQDGL